MMAPTSRRSVCPASAEVQQGPAAEPGPVHFLDGLRCPTCTTLNASWLLADGAAVQCAECGQTCLAIGPEEVA